LRRLFSTFARGWPGWGLLLLRLVAGLALITQGFTGRTGPIEPVIRATLAVITGILLIVGLWTPVSGSLAALLGLWNAVSQLGDPWASILLGTIGAALAMIGPGAWSVDARLFGWRRIDIGDRERKSRSA
jgi:hypothetical protein